MQDLTLMPHAADYAIMVPKVDASTGLTTSGIRGVEVQAPLGTSIEFNYVAAPGIVDLASLTGSYIPFHATEAARVVAGDGRPSLESLYGNQAGYVNAVTTAANSLEAEASKPRACCARASTHGSPQHWQPKS